MRRPAAFLDKDGTLLEDVPGSAAPERMRWLSGAKEGVRTLAEAGFLLFVVSNQPAVAFGTIRESQLSAVRRRLAEMFAEAGARLCGFYYCPHDPRGSIDLYARACRCRKPRPGLILRAAREHRIDLARSWMAGDILHDVEAGRRAGCRAILIDNGGETEWTLSPLRLPDASAPDLAAAARSIARWSS